MAERTCSWCGASIAHMRSNAQYCSREHKKNAAGKRFRERNPGYYSRYSNCDRQIAWREQNAEILRAKARAYQAALPDRAERGRTWRQANRVYYQVRERNRRAMKLNNPGSVGVSERDWVKLCRRYRHCCAYCGTKTTNPEMDHVIPLSKGGRHAIGNVLPACHSCNVSKGANLLAVWMRRRAYELMAKLYGSAA